MITYTSTFLSHRNTLIYEHTSSYTLPTCDNSLDLLRLRASEAGNIVEFLLL